MKTFAACDEGQGEGILSFPGAPLLRPALAMPCMGSPLGSGSNETGTQIQTSRALWGARFPALPTAPPTVAGPRAMQHDFHYCCLAGPGALRVCAVERRDRRRCMKAWGRCSVSEGCRARQKERCKCVVSLATVYAETGAPCCHAACSHIPGGLASADTSAGGVAQREQARTLRTCGLTWDGCKAVRNEGVEACAQWGVGRRGCTSRAFTLWGNEGVDGAQAAQLVTQLGRFINISIWCLFTQPALVGAESKEGQHQDGCGRKNVTLKRSCGSTRPGQQRLDTHRRCLRWHPRSLQ